MLLNVLRSAANVLEDGPNRHAWLDLSPDRQMKVATSLMLALEENAFLLAGVTEQPEEILETYETLSKFSLFLPSFLASNSRSLQKLLGLFIDFCSEILIFLR